jgi:murein L,D-transpeptidase YafK
VVLAAFKQERQLEVYAASPSGPLRFIRAYPIKAASGHLGPKLQEGDCQVPEGLYSIEYLNPNSSYHLSMKIDYPNAFDRMRGTKDGRLQLGGDIMIHGNDVSVGCLAMGDAAAEDLFVLAAQTGIKNISVILSPVDFRVRNLPLISPGAHSLPPWTQDLYPQIRTALQNLPAH